MYIASKNCCGGLSKVELITSILIINKHVISSLVKPVKILKKTFN